MHLVTISNQQENDWVWNSFGSVAGYFLGGTDENIEGAWEWVTGEAWNYENWNGGEPNNFPWKLSTGEDAIEFAADGKWNDIPITSYSNGGYIVEYESAPVPEPTTILLLGTGLIGLVGFRRKKFKKR